MSIGTVILTGCASGIGRHLTGAFDRRGWTVLASDLSQETLQQCAAEDGWSPGVSLHALDVRDSAAWTALVDVPAKLDLVANVAGYLMPAWVDEIDDDHIDKHFDINVKGVVLGTRAAARRMKAQGFGHIINVGSMASLAPVPGLSLYGASKYAVRSFSLAAAIELKASGVALSLLCPDAVKTPMLELQEDYEQASLTFSGPKLTVQDIERAVFDTLLVDRPLELALPRHREVLARIADLAPGISRAMYPILKRVGERSRRATRKATRQR